jgi:hypothetical protein
LNNAKIGYRAANSGKLRNFMLLFYPAVVATNGLSVTIRENPSEQGLGGVEGLDAGILIAFVGRCLR